MAFDLRALIPGIGGLAPHGGGGFMAGWQRAAQEAEHRKQLQRQQAQQQQQTSVQNEQLGFQRDANARAGTAETRATQDQSLQVMNSLRQLLEDPSIDNPADYATRMTFAQNMAPQLGVEPGFVAKTFAVKPDVFTARKAKKVVAEIQSDRQVQKWITEGHDLENQVFEKDGERHTLNEWRTLAQTAAPVGAPAALPPKPNQVNPGSFEDYVIRYAKDHGKTAEALTSADLEDARKRYQQSDDRIIVNTGGNLPPRIQTLVSQKQRTFESLPAVKNTQIMSEAVSFANSLDQNTKNPADDQALIYAFAKAMDPNSVVREGEYATVQRYAQSWAESFGFNAARIFSNTTFLTPQARANMKATIQNRFKAAEGQYRAVRNSYASQINRLTQNTDGADYLTDYGAAFPSEASSGGMAANPTTPQTTGPRVTPPTAGGGRGTAPGQNPFRR